MQKIEKKLASELKINIDSLRATIKLIDEGNTIPFIARYRKELTGNLDDENLRLLDDRLNHYRNLEARKLEVKRLIDEQDKLNNDLEEAIERAESLSELDDIYRPYRPKRRTRATMARARGLEPLADILSSQELLEGNILKIAESYIDSDREIEDSKGALEGAMDIIAEDISDNAEFRKLIREYTYKRGLVESSGDEDKDSLYKIYYDYSEPIRDILPHRILAINRGEREGFLSVKLSLNLDNINELLKDKIIKNPNFIGLSYLEMAIEDSYKRLIAPSIEREIRNELTERAEEQAIDVFAKNLNKLLLQPPINDRIVMGIDPGFRTGNKLAIIDETGKVLETGLVYMTLAHHNIDEAKALIKALIKKHGVQIVAIGNGTASRETELVVSELLKDMEEEVFYMVISEAGASIYSASKLAREEFPDYDVSLRSAVSIARRLQDPLAELVKIEPKGIGVGQYQHDVNQKRLDESLKGVVENCVNSVGVDLNTASYSLLQYIAGINRKTAMNIVARREETGRFNSRKELLKVKNLGPKTYEQCAGFLRIEAGLEALDNTAVHPESYAEAKKLLDILGYEDDDRLREGLDDLNDRLLDTSIEELSSKLNIGSLTLMDIVEELKKPGRDPRDILPKPILRTDILSMDDIRPGMEFKGTVRNVVDFGAFVDIGLDNDGLVHISQLSDRYVKHPMDVVQLGDIVNVRVLDVNKNRNRISLSMKSL